MQILGLGNDIIEVDRIRQAIDRQGQRFLDRLFTEREQAYCQKHSESERHFAGRWAAKEAIAKALGSGFGENASWLDIEIVNNDKGKPVVSLSPGLIARSGEMTVELSISHCRDYATAVAVIVQG